MTTVPRVADDRLRDNLPLNYGAMSAAARSLLRRMGRCCGTGLAVLELPAAGAAERPLFTFTENEVTFGLVECDWPELNPVAARLGGRVKAWSEPDHHVV
jgi:hypothetical protein